MFSQQPCVKGVRISKLQRLYIPGRNYFLFSSLFYFLKTLFCFFGNNLLEVKLSSISIRKLTFNEPHKIITHRDTHKTLVPRVCVAFVQRNLSPLAYETRTLGTRLRLRLMTDKLNARTRSHFRSRLQRRNWFIPEKSS